MREDHYALSRSLFGRFQVLHLQEEDHNASIFLICLGWSFLNPSAKLVILSMYCIYEAQKNVT